MPQYSVHHTPLSPGIYRKLFFAAQHGLADAGLANARVLLGETSPRGTGKVVAPLTFLRGALCLDSKYHKTEHGLREAPARRLRPSRLHDGPGPDLQAHAAQRRHHRRALAADHRPRPRREGRRDHLAPADLPDRVRHREHARPGARGEPAAPVGVPRDLRAHRLRQPARRGLLAVPAARRPAQGRRAHDRRATRASRRACSRTAGQAQAVLRRLPPAARRAAHERDEGLDLGPRAAGRRRDDGEHRGALQGRLLPRADDGARPTPAATSPRARATPAGASGAWSGRRRTGRRSAGRRRVPTPGSLPGAWRSSSGSCGTARPSPTTRDRTPTAASPIAGASSRASRAARWRR